jgi:hypothetical protein
MKMTIFSNKYILSFFGGCLFLLSSCIKDLDFASSANLKWSKDTVYFDTIFTRDKTTGYPISVTKLISIKNPENRWVKADFSVVGGKNSPFSINIDGVAGPEISGLEIAPKDSVFVFVQCRLQANNQTQPALVLDSLYARVGNKQSKLILAAYGWDAHYVKDTVFPANTIWSDQVKPYVIIGAALVAPGRTFQINPGVKVYASAQTVLYVLGDLQLNGTAQNRITIKGDKPVSSTEKLPNQWGGIWFLPGGKGNLEYSDITNASVGLRADSTGCGNSPCVNLSQTRIQYCGTACLIGLGGAIKAENCLFADAGTYTFLAYFGGKYQFNNCTFAEHSNFGNRQDGSFAVTNTYRDGNGKLLASNDLDLKITNCLVWGYKIDEITTDKVTQSAWAISDENNYFKSKNENTHWNKTSNIFNRDPLFENVSNGDYQLKSNSPAISSANIATASAIDILGKQRKSAPDIGAYEKF